MARSRPFASSLVWLLLLAPAAAGTPAPVNDTCGTAIAIPALPFRSTEAAITLASSAPDDPRPSCTSGQGHDTIWFRYTPAVSGRVELTTRTSWHDNFLWVGTGACGTLQEIACADDTAGFFNAEVTFLAEAGQTYTIMAGSYFPLPWGTLTLIAEDAAPLNGPAPANDSCRDAITLATVPEVITATGWGATEELTDLSPTCWPGADNYTLWYQYTSPIDRQIRLDTTASTDSTWLTVATGSCGALVPIDCDWTSGVNSHGVVDFLARAGVTYHIQLSRYFPPGPGDVVEMVIQDGSSVPIHVQVTDAVSGDPLAGAHVQVRDLTGGFYLMREGWTDAAGRLTLYVVNPDSYDLQVVAELHVVESRPITMGTGPLSVDFALTPMTGIRAASSEPTRLVMAAEQSLVTFLPDGSDERVLALTGFSSVRFPSWSPDGSEIAFEGYGPAASSFEVWIVKSDGSGLRQLTRFNGDPGRQRDLAWSPDGQELAFAWFVDMWATAFSIHVVDAATGTNLRELEIGEDPSWSPDSTMIAYAAPWGPRAMRRDGSHVVTLNEFTGTGIDWSNDGTRLALSNGNEAIIAIPIHGRDPVKVAATQSNYAMWPAWSPDSCLIAFDDEELSVAYLDVAFADGSGFHSPWLASARGEFDWSHSPSPPDVPGDLAPRVTLLDPDGGERLDIGQPYTIRWQATDDIGVTAVDLYAIRSGVATPIALGLPGTQSSYNWVVSGPPSDTGAAIQVRVHDAVMQEHRDTSRYPVSIAGAADPYHQVKLTWPVGGSLIEAGDVLRITWDFDARSPFTGDGFHLQISFDGGNSYRDYVYDFVGQDERFYDWTVPAYASGLATIRIRSSGAYDETGVFTISPGGVEGPGASRARLLLGVRDGGDAVFTWGAPGAREHVHRTALKTALPGVWAQPPHASSLIASYRDPEPAPGAAAPWFYQVFATDCAGSSRP